MSFLQMLKAGFAFALGIFLFFSVLSLGAALLTA
jgi:hypothetical protein